FASSWLRLPLGSAGNGRLSIGAERGSERIWRAMGDAAGLGAEERSFRYRSRSASSGRTIAPFGRWRELDARDTRAYIANRASGRRRVRGNDCVLLISVTQSQNFDELFSARARGPRAQSLTPMR